MKLNLQRIRAAIRRRVRYRITGGGILYFVALLLVGYTSFLTANNLLFLVFSAMLAILLVSGFLSRLMLSGLELELLLPEHVWARTASPARVRLRNLKRITPSFSLELTGQRNALSNSPPILTAPVYFPIIPGRTTVETPVDVTFPPSRPPQGKCVSDRHPVPVRFPAQSPPLSRSSAKPSSTPRFEPFPGAGNLLDQTGSGETGNRHAGPRARISTASGPMNPATAPATSIGKAPPTPESPISANFRATNRA